MNGTTAFEYVHDGLRMVGQLARPASLGPVPAVMVMHDGQGVSDFVRQRAKDLADRGYIALATDMFGGGERPPQAEGIRLVQTLRKEGSVLRDRVVASFRALRDVPGVDPGRIGAIGYCFGGQCVLELARSGAHVEAVVSFHGTLGTTLSAEPGAVKAKVLVLTGALDPFAPQSDLETFKQEMTQACVDWTMTIYSNGKHGFTDPIADKAAETMAGVGYDAALDRLSWAQAMSFLDAHLRDG